METLKLDNPLLRSEDILAAVVGYFERDSPLAELDDAERSGARVWSGWNEVKKAAVKAEKAAVKAEKAAEEAKKAAEEAKKAAEEAKKAGEEAKEAAKEAKKAAEKAAKEEAKTAKEEEEMDEAVVIKKKKRMDALINVDITCTNDECFLGSVGLDDVCYNTTQNRHLIVRDMTINFRLNQQTYRGVDTKSGIKTGTIYKKISLAQAAINSKNHKQRGEGFVVRMNKKGNIKFTNIFYNDTLMWGENSVEPKHNIMAGHYMAGASYIKPADRISKKDIDKYYKWVEDYDVDFMLAKETKKAVKEAEKAATFEAHEYELADGTTVYVDSEWTAYNEEGEELGVVDPKTNILT